MLTAIENTSQRTLTLIENIQALMQESRDLIQKNAARGVYSKDLVELVFRQPYCRINSLIKASLTTSRITAKRYLKELVRLGVLEEIRYSGELLYLNIRLMSLLANS